MHTLDLVKQHDKTDKMLTIGLVLPPEPLSFNQKTYQSRYSCKSLLLHRLLYRTFLKLGLLHLSLCGKRCTTVVLSKLLGHSTSPTMDDDSCCSLVTNFIEEHWQFLYLIISIDCKVIALALAAMMALYNLLPSLCCWCDQCVVVVVCWFESNESTGHCTKTT